MNILPRDSGKTRFDHSTFRNQSRQIWSPLNRIISGHAVTKATLHKWGMTDTAQCDCGASEQSLAHILHDFPKRKFEGT